MNQQYGGYPAQPAQVGSLKNPALAAVLGFFFGFLGLFYSTVSGALIILGVDCVLGFVGLLGGVVISVFLYFVSWFVCAYMGYYAATEHNKKLTLPQQPLPPGPQQVAYPASPPAAPPVVSDYQPPQYRPTPPPTVQQPPRQHPPRQQPYRPSY
jgi:hypothetical protein